MLILLLLRRLSPRTAVIFGAVVVTAGLALVALSAAVSAGLLAHGIALVVIGAVLCAGAVNRRRARPASQTGAEQELASAGRTHGR